MLSDYCFFNDERYSFGNDERDLHLYGFYFGLVNIDFLVFNAITIGRHWYLSYYFIWNPSLDLHLDCLFTLYDTLNYSLHFHYFNDLLVLDDYLFHDHFNDFLYLLDDDVGHWDFHDLQDGLLYDYDAFDYLWHLDNLLDNPWHDHDLLYDLLDLDHSWYLDYLLYDFLDDLFLYSHDFFLHDNWNRMIDPNLLHNLFFNRD